MRLRPSCSMPPSRRIFLIHDPAARVGAAAMLLVLAACDGAAGEDGAGSSGATSANEAGVATTDEPEETLGEPSLDTAAGESTGTTTSAETEEGAAGSTSDASPSGMEDTETNGSIEPTDPFPGMGEPELIISELGFGEGPVWSAPRQTLFFADVYADEILAFDGVDVSVHRSNTGGQMGWPSTPRIRSSRPRSPRTASRGRPTVASR